MLGTQGSLTWHLLSLLVLFVALSTDFDPVFA